MKNTHIALMNIGIFMERTILIVVLLLTLISIYISGALADNPVTEEVFRQRVNDIFVQYPAGTQWLDWYSNAHQCRGWAFYLADYVFKGDARTWEYVYDISNVKVGDIVQYGDTSGSGHTIFVLGVDSNTIVYADCNGNENYRQYPNNGSGKCCIGWNETIGKYDSMFGKYSFNYIISSPGIGSVNHSPEASFDEAKGGTGTLTVSGWAYDPDDTSAALEIHVYAQDSAGNATFIGKTTANGSRTDVDDAFHCGSNHGFNATFYTTLSGNYTIRVAALDTQTGGNGATWREKGDVNIAKDTTNPSVSVIDITNIEKTKFRVVVSATDNAIVAKVRIPIWRVSQGGGSAAWYDAVQTNTTTWYADVSCGTEEQAYCGHAYAYDLQGNSASTGNIEHRNLVITYNANGGTCGTDSKELAAAWFNDTAYQKYGTLPTPTRTDYTFEGWYTGASGGTKVTADSKVTTKGDHTLYAHWFPNTYTVTYSANGGTGAPANQTKTHGTTLTLSSTRPTRDGYTFRGWGTSTSAAEAVYSPGASYTANGNVTLYAIWAANGAEMQTGAGRSIIDGDYLIRPSGNMEYFLDISGAEEVAPEGRNVQIYTYGANIVPPTYDAFTVTYLNNGFYSIKQRGSNMALTVADGSVAPGANVQVSAYTGSAAQQWSITQAYTGDTRKGLRVQNRCSGFSLDVSSGRYTNSNNVIQWSDNTNGPQSWVFIPYEPEHTLADGRYILVSNLDADFELDVSGDFADVPDGQNVQLWCHADEEFAAEAKSQFNSFDVEYIGDGYYKVLHAASGKALSVSQVNTNYSQNICVQTYTGSDSQKWAIVRDNGAYALLAACSGYAVDIQFATAKNGQNIQQYPYRYQSATGSHQLWHFVPAEYTVSYDANGGATTPDSQVKYFKGNLTLSDVEPMRAGYLFEGWSLSSDAKSADYLPGDIFTTDENTTLYAVWSAPDFILPDALTEIDEEAFAGSAFTYVVLPEGVKRIERRAFADCPNLCHIYIPANAFIAEDAFSGVPEGLTIHGRLNSIAYYFAMAHNYKFVAE